MITINSRSKVRKRRDGQQYPTGKVVTVNNGNNIGGSGFDQTGNYSPTGTWNFLGTLQKNGSDVLTSSNGNLVVTGSIKSGRLGYYGQYNYQQVQGIWSIDSNYKISTSENTFGNQYGLTYAYSNTGGSHLTSEHQINFVNNGSIAASIGITKGSALFGLNGGNVGIGTTIAQYGKLEIKPTAGNVGTGLALYVGSGNTFRIWAGTSDKYYIGRGGSETNGITMLADGSIGIKNSSPSQALDVNGLVQSKTSNGYLVVGPQNSSWAHFTTDRPSFYFSTKVTIKGHLYPYTNAIYDIGHSSYKWNQAHFQQLWLYNLPEGSVGLSTGQVYMERDGTLKVVLGGDTKPEDPID